MKTFVLFALTLCVAQCEMSHKLITEKGQRFKSKLDQGIHHRAGVAGAGRSIRQFLRKKFAHPKALPEPRSSNRFVRSVPSKGYSDYADFVVGDITSVDLGFGSGSSSGYGSGYGSGDGSGYGSAYPFSISLTNGFGPDGADYESQSIYSPTTYDRRNYNTDKKSKPAISNWGILQALKPDSRAKRSVIGFGEIGSGFTSGEGSGSDISEDIIISSETVRLEYAQGGDSVATSIGSGSVTCIGVGCEQGSGSIEIQEGQITFENTSVQPNSVTGEEYLSSGMYAVAHQP